MKRFIPGAWLLCLLILAAPPAVGAAALPDELVRNTAGKILGQIDSNYEAYRADPELLAEVIRADMLPLLDMNYAARLILGRAGRGASQVQIDSFTTAMTQLLIDRYADGLMSFRSEDQLEVLPLKGTLNERATRVRTRVLLQSGERAPVDYVFRKSGEDWKVFDVVIEGISYVTTYRNQIIPEVEATGLDAVIERLNNGELILQD